MAGVCEGEDPWAMEENEETAGFMERVVQWAMLTAEPDEIEDWRLMSALPGNVEDYKEDDLFYMPWVIKRMNEYRARTIDACSWYGPDTPVLDVKE